MKNGFTQVELIVVIAIISILAAIVSPNAYRAIEKAKITRVLADIKGLKTAALAYYGDVNMWPPDVCPSEDPGFMGANTYTSKCCGTTPTAAEAAIIASRWNGPYLEKGFTNTPWGGSYDWEFWPSGGWTLPAGVYVSVRPYYGTVQKGQACGCVASSIAATSVPDRFQIQLQQEGFDLYHINGVDVADSEVIAVITNF